MTVWRRDLHGPWNHSEKKTEMMLRGSLLPEHNLTHPNRLQWPFKKRHFTSGGIRKSLLTSLRSELHKKYQWWQGQWWWRRRPPTWRSSQAAWILPRLHCCSCSETGGHKGRVGYDGQTTGKTCASQIDLSRWQVITSSRKPSLASQVALTFPSGFPGYLP